MVQNKLVLFFRTEANHPNVVIRLGDVNLWKRYFPSIASRIPYVLSADPREIKLDLVTRCVSLKL